jgi:hypothetical protein
MRLRVDLNPAHVAVLYSTAQIGDAVHSAAISAGFQTLRADGKRQISTRQQVDAMAGNLRGPVLWRVANRLAKILQDFLQKAVDISAKR